MGGEGVQGGVLLRDLQSQWLLGMLRNLIRSKYIDDDEGTDISQRSLIYKNPGCYLVFGGIVLRDDRCAFHMVRYRGDLRKLIDLRMQHNNNQDPPFDKVEALLIMGDLAEGMQGLHKHGILHRDIKASNVLISPTCGSITEFDPMQDPFECCIADFECSVGVVGTRFWRASEILWGLKNRKPGMRVHSSLFTEQSDVYSHGMTCYEILTGRIPFEVLKDNDYHVVIGARDLSCPNTSIPF